MKRLMMWTALLIVGVAIVGCGKKQLTASDVRKQLADDLVTPYETQGEVDNRIAHTSTTNLRGFNLDLMRLLLLERPHRSMHYPTVRD